MLTIYICVSGLLFLYFCLFFSVGFAESTLRANTGVDGALFVGWDDSCSGKSVQQTKCEASTNNFSWIVVAAADDCSCVTCNDEGIPTPGNCNVPVAQMDDAGRIL